MEIHITELSNEQLNTILNKLFGHSIEYKNYINDNDFIIKLQEIEQIDITHWPQLRNDVKDWVMATITTQDSCFVQYGENVRQAILKVYVEKCCGSIINV